MDCTWQGNGELDLIPTLGASQKQDIKNCSNVPDLKTIDVTTLRLINDQDRLIITIFFSCFLGIPICLVGIAGNIINIIVFLRQGFSDSINISLLCLSISDLGSLLTLLWRNILYIPYVGRSSLPIDAVSFIYLTAGTPHVTFVRLSGCITAFIALERCVCIVLPLKVKSIFTHRKTVIVNAAIFIFTIAAIVPLYYSNRIVWKFYPNRNRTLLGMEFTENYHAIERASFVLNGLFIPFSSFFIDLVCTVMMVYRLKMQAKWRQETSDGMSQKDLRVMKLVMTLTIIFIVCSLPINVNYVWKLTDKDVNVQGKYANTLLVSASFAFLCEAINSSLNHFVYIRMSSKFLATYMEMFPFFRKKLPE